MHSSSSLWNNPYDVGNTINHSNSTHYSDNNHKENQDIVMNGNNNNCNNDDEDTDINMNVTKKANINGGRTNVPQKHKELDEMQKKLHSMGWNRLNGRKRTFNMMNGYDNNNNGFNGANTEHFDYAQSGFDSGPLPKRQRY